MNDSIGDNLDATKRKLFSKIVDGDQISPSAFTLVSADAIDRDTSLLMLCCDRDHSQCLKCALDALQGQRLRDALEWSNANGNIALHFAARKSLDCMILLLDADSTKKTAMIRCNNNQTAFDYACAAGNIDVVRYFATIPNYCDFTNQTKAKLSCLMLSIISKSVETFRFVTTLIVDQQPNVLKMIDNKGTFKLLFN
jgi:hypothetical protein